MALIELHGELGSRFGRSHQLDVKTTAEAFRALCANFSEMKKYLLDSEERGLGYLIFVKNKNIDIDDIHDPVGISKIKVVPVIAGGGLRKFFKRTLSKPAGKIIVGSLLIAAAFFMPTTTLFTIGATSFSYASIAFSIGTSLVLGGAAQYLAGTPDAPDIPLESSPNNVPSNRFNGAVNTTAQGHPVPVGYGRLLVGSAVVSAEITVDQVDV